MILEVNNAVTKGYSLLDILFLIISSDVLFVEHIFPYKHSQIVSHSSSYSSIPSSFLASIDFDIVLDSIAPSLPLSDNNSASDVDHNIPDNVSSPSLSSEFSHSKPIPLPAPQEGLLGLEIYQHI